MPENSRYFLGVVAIFKGENDYLIEWIEFHRMMGVEHFVLYDNGPDPNSYKILKPYINTDIVTYISFPDLPMIKNGKHADTLTTQQLAYADCIFRFKHHFQYLLEVDIDEFIFPKKHNTITEVLQKYKPKEVKGLEVNWLNFGNDNHINKPPGLVIENYTMTEGFQKNSNVKSIGNTDYFSNLFKYSNVHHFSYRFSIGDRIKNIIKGYPRTICGDEVNNLLQLNHYKTKSKEEYLRKAEINYGGWITGDETEGKFINFNKQYNQIENKAIFRFIERLKERIESDST